MVPYFYTGTIQSYAMDGFNISLISNTITQVGRNWSRGCRENCVYQTQTHFLWATPLELISTPLKFKYCKSLVSISDSKGSYILRLSKSSGCAMRVHDELASGRFGFYR